jgi:hypothetical protein
MAEYLMGPPRGGVTSDCPQFPQHQAHLREIAETIEKGELQVGLLESRPVTGQPEFLQLFLEDCRVALTTFKDVGGRLAGIIGPDTGGKPSVTAAETLIQIMQVLKACSQRVSGLPETGMAVPSQCLAQTAFSLQKRASKLIGDAAIQP